MTAISRRLRSQTINAALFAACIGSAFGCGADFDTQDKVKTLRVLAVRSDYPYAAPTLDPSLPNQVHLTMLSHNALPSAANADADSDAGAAADQSPIQRLWFSGCDDLPGDQYFTCLARMAFLWQFYVGTNGKALGDGEWWSVKDYVHALGDQEIGAIQSLLPNLNPTLRIDKLDPTLPLDQLDPEQIDQLQRAEAYLDTYRIGAGERFTYPIPEGIIENHKSTDPGTPPFGLAFVFFTVCAGHIDLAPEWANLRPGTTLRDATLGFPFLCREGAESNGGEPLVPSGTGKPLDSDYFVGGYTQQFVYSDPSVNKNPVISGVTFNDTRYNFHSDGTAQEADSEWNDITVDASGNEVPAADSGVLCLDGSCVPGPTASTKCADGAPSVPACKDHCPKYELTPKMVAALNNDVDTFSSSSGSSVGEQMWIDFYADRGEFDRTAKSLRDPSLGWLPDTQGQNIGDKWKPPADPGPALLWAVVHDSRAGTAWLRLQVCVTQ